MNENVKLIWETDRTAQPSLASIFYFYINTSCVSAQIRFNQYLIMLNYDEFLTL